MNICGVLVHVRPNADDEVRRELGAMPGVTVHHVTDNHRMIVTVEDTEGTSAADQNLAIHRVPGVVSAALVYHRFEPDQEACHGPV